jgi:predicted  nucleic acid-binding Zn-ribbon protein
MKQKIDFQESQMRDQQLSHQQAIERFEERIKQEKEDASKTLNERMARMQQDNENLEKKYEQKRKALKDLEKQVQQQNSQVERDMAV